MLTKREAARLIDISAVQTHHSELEIEELVTFAKKYKFINAHVLPCRVSMLRAKLKDEHDVLVGSPVGFPTGGQKTCTKILEAMQLIEDGVQEMDIMINLGKFKDGDYDYVAKELKSILSIVDNSIPTKTIIEINLLTNEEMIKACTIAAECGSDYVKTGTGWIPGSANIDRIRIMKEFCKDKIKIKAAGGIRTKKDFIELTDMGVERLGINTESAIEIINCLPD